MNSVIKLSLCIGIALLAFACKDKKTETIPVNERNEIFNNLFSEVPDTSFQIGENKLLFIKTTEKDLETDSKLFIVEKEKNEWKCTREKMLYEGVMFSSIDSLRITTIGDSSYLYYEYYQQGGSMGNHNVDFVLYNYDNDQLYTLFYEFYPQNQGDVFPQFTDSENLSQPVNDFLESKAAISDRVLDTDSKEFRAFISEFCSNREAQITHIKFPVGFWLKKIEGNCSPESPYYDDYYGECLEKVPFNQSNWTFLEKKTLTPFFNQKDNSFGSWSKPSPNTMVFSSGWVESELAYSATFERVNGKWMLTEYYGGY
ncbi:hypothetical protein [Dysgonomonas sp. 520]|uniref:hypothetical protein n=1 Tax=Dysgonomonas sp. 520 TaxID=2302931 RepID=UPI0013D6A706|nr:hypothetical protein [Dysgonomonas sp. 520]NDW10547.1 hypothetical protein [Dysgonomonas sp. 520]